MDLINVWIMEFAVTNACRMFVDARNIYRLVTVLREHVKNSGIGNEDPTIKRPDTNRLKIVGRGVPKIVLETINNGSGTYMSRMRRQCSYGGRQTVSMES